MATPIKWEDADFSWDNNSYTWDDVQLVEEVVEALQQGGGGDMEEMPWIQWDKDKKKKLIKLILKVHGNTITESKQKEIKQYKITAKDIKIVVKEVLGAEMIAEDVSI
jgi:hypothetical protein